MIRERSSHNTALNLTAALLLLLISSTDVSGAELLGKSSGDSLTMQFDNTASEIIAIPADADLGYYVDASMKRSTALKQAFYRWRAAVEKSGYAGSLPDPMVSFAYFVEHVETRVGPQEQRFGLTQKFPWFGTLGAKKDIATEAANAEYQKLESVRLQLKYKVTSAYYDYYFIGQDLQITQDNMDLLQFWESVTRSKYKVGLKQHPDLIKAQVELGKLEDQVKTLEDRMLPAAARLRALLDLPDTTMIPVPETADVREFNLFADSVIAAARTNNPDLRALEHLIGKEEAGVRLAGKLSLPSFTFGVDYIRTGPAINPDMPESGKDPWMVGVGMSLPIWFGKNRARSSEARARQQMAEYGYEESKNQLIAYTEQVLFDYSDALRKTRLYRDGLVPKAEQSLNASYVAYQAGETDFLNVLDAQRQLLDFQLTVERERVRLAKNAAELEMLTGQELELYREQP